MGIVFIAIATFFLIGCPKKKNTPAEKVDIKPKEDAFAVISLIGKKLYPLPVTETVRNNYKAAKAAFEKAANEDNTIWFGRRKAYMYHYEDAIKIFNNGIKKFPNSYRLYRHRGHRYISVRKFKNAIADLQRATELIKGKPLEMEPDGIPNKLNKPLSNTQFNCWYHLGLAYYLSGEFEEAASAYKECLKWSDNKDLIVATTDWLYMTYRRMEKEAEAQSLLKGIEEGWEIIENSSYYNRLLMYKGLKTPESLLKSGTGTEYEKNLNLATQGYGVGNWYFYNGDLEKAISTFRQVLEGKSWSAFGYIAAEVDLFNHINKK
jgi:tetratricopeptide (TPR) repeat protein